MGSMGGYIPSFWDNQIRAALTGRFSDTGIPPGHAAHVPGHNENFMEQMKRHHRSENMFDRTAPKSLERVAHRLAHSIAMVAPTDTDARRRWYWLLNPASGIMPATTADKIRDAISTALAPNSVISSLQFTVTYNTRQHLRYDLDVVDAEGVRTLILISNLDAMLPTPTPGQQPLNPPRSAGEHPMNNAPVP
jgi:hypothetical protein